MFGKKDHPKFSDLGVDAQSFHSIDRDEMWRMTSENEDSRSRWREKYAKSSHSVYVF